ncbi:stalk domain-containing protein [Paenibacillus eucommiae]|uniref:Copper amine oxidase-like N-terminal domain-containing protein n=1 Tax=Paenibacillus eucommiae TaxID=1355755 RepID=A0ABS4IPW1_9BACL|nr:hypothetical protein [Paenibacillus eucommiae]MBP1989607.1 hypothetical protein [Paenibacillus eucommiae]
MKKFVIGMLIGGILTASTATYASDSIQAVLYSVKYIINGKEENPIENGYRTLNFDGHAYLPLRYISDKLGAAVLYDEDSKLITLDNGFTIIDPRNFIRAGYINTSKNTQGTLIDGKLYFSGNSLQMFDFTTDTTASEGELIFWNSEGKIIDKAPFAVNINTRKDQIVSFHTMTQSDVTDYETVTLEGTTPIHLLHTYRPFMTTKDAESKIMIGLELLGKSGDYSTGTLQIGSFVKGMNNIEAVVTFYGNQSEILGSARIHAPSINGPLDPNITDPIGESIPFIAKGDITNYKTFAVKLISITPVE